jgi:hypothetical protein
VAADYRRRGKGRLIESGAGRRSLTSGDFRLLVAVVVAVPTYWFTCSVIVQRWPRPLFGMHWQRSAAVLVAFAVAGLVLALTDQLFG